MAANTKRPRDLDPREAMMYYDQRIRDRLATYPRQGIESDKLLWLATTRRDVMDPNSMLRKAIAGVITAYARHTGASVAQLLPAQNERITATLCYLDTLESELDR